MITGASSGIGLALVRYLLATHPDLEVVGLSRRAGPLEGEPRYHHWPTDLVCLDAVSARARRYVQEVGRCDLLVCAAGVGGFVPTDAWNAEQLATLITVNLTSPMLVCSELLPTLRKTPGALVVLLGSTASRERSPLGAAYAASKSGLKGFAESLFMESRKQGVRVMHLAPGMTDTPFYQAERFAPEPGPETALAPEPLAELVDFFFSGAGRSINPTHLVLEPQRVGVQKRPQRP